jgi:hypothetical protein
MYRTNMYNQSEIWASRLRNREFQSFFATNSIFSIKLKANTFGFIARIYIQNHYV